MRAAIWTQVRQSLTVQRLNTSSYLLESVAGPSKRSLYARDHAASPLLPCAVLPSCRRPKLLSRTPATHRGRSPDADISCQRRAAPPCRRPSRPVAPHAGNDATSRRRLPVVPAPRRRSPEVDASCQRRARPPTRRPCASEAVARRERRREEFLSTPAAGRRCMVSRRSAHPEDCHGRPWPPSGHSGRQPESPRRSTTPPSPPPSPDVDTSSPRDSRCSPPPTVDVRSGDPPPHCPHTASTVRAASRSRERVLWRRRKTDAHREIDAARNVVRGRTAPGAAGTQRGRRWDLDTSRTGRGMKDSGAGLRAGPRESRRTRRAPAQQLSARRLRH